MIKYVNHKKSKEKMGRQIVLPMRMSVEITLKNLRVRFLRSLITVMSLVLAVAFLGFIFAGNDIANGMLQSGGPEARRMLVQGGYDLDEGQTEIGTSAKERWIVILSLLVCTVGIVNAQLMSVTERFREIGVMKCLGALDRIVLRLFLLESLFMGLGGAGAGALLGLVAALLQGLFRFGLASLVNLSWGQALTSALMALGVGCGLSVLGVLYPAIVAARMRPVVAMRADL